MRVSYDYEEFIEELKQEISDGVLLPTDTIQVLRANREIDRGYKPIIDWYYNHETTLEDLEIDDDDDQEEIKEKQIMKELYKRDKDFLELVSVAGCLLEMKERNKIL